MSKINTEKVKAAIDLMKTCIVMMKRFKEDMFDGIMAIPVNKTSDILVEDFESIQQYLDWIEEDLDEMLEDVKKLEKGE